MTDNKTYIYASNDTRTALVIYSFSLFAIMSTILPILGGYFLILLNKIQDTPTDEAKAALINMGDYHDKLNGATSIVYLICAIIFLFWNYRASANAHALFPEKKFRFSPPWNVGSYFIPILSLFWPYQATKELWLTTTKNTNKDTTLLLVWWLAFLFMNFTATVTSKLSMTTIPEIQIYVTVNAFSNICGIISALLAVKMVREINQGEKR